MKTAWLAFSAIACSCAFGACAPETADLTESAPLSLHPDSVGPTNLAYGFVDGLITSTGNMYWTNYWNDELSGTNGAALMRASKSNTPGHESTLYSESGTSYLFFGSVVWALVGGNYYGYFSANYTVNGAEVSYIKRVSLAGGSAVKLAQSPAYIGVRDLATDGSYIYWVDAAGVRRVPIGGGTPTLLAATTVSQHLALDASHVYYEQNNLILRVPKAGGSSTIAVTAAANVTAFYVDPSSGFIFYGEHGGAVRRLAFGSTYTYQGPLGGYDVISVGFDGTRTLWIDCAEPGNTTCDVRAYLGGGSTLTVNAGQYSVGSRSLQWDASNLYWSDGSGIKKYTY
jgi:hypothetical protein